MIGQTLFNALVIGRMRSAPVQSLVIVAVLIMGVVAGTTLGLVDDAVRASIAAGVTRLSSAVNIQVTSPAGSLPEDALRIVRRLPGMRDAQPVVAGIAEIETRDGSRVLRLEGVDLFALHGDRAFREALLPGLYANGGTQVPLSTLLDGNALIVSPAFAAALHLQRGMTVAARVRGMPVRFSLVAVAPESLELDDPNVALIDVAAAQALFGSSGRIDRIDITVPEDRIAPSIAALKQQLPAANVERPVNRLAALSRAVSGVRGTLAILDIVIAMLAAIVVLNTAGSAVIERSREVAILRALGAPRRTLLIVFLIEALIYGVGASFFGMLIGGLVAPEIAHAAQAALTAGAPVVVPPAIAVDFGSQVRVFVASAALATVASLLPALQILRRRGRARRTTAWLWSRATLAGGGGTLAAALLLHFAPAVSPSIPVLLVLLGSCLCIAPAIVWLATATLRWRALPRPQTWLAAVFAREPAPAALLGMATLVVAIALLASASIVETSEQRAAWHGARAAYPGDIVVRDPRGVLHDETEPGRLAGGLIASAVYRRTTRDTVIVVRPGVSAARVLAALAPAARAPGVTIESTADLLRAATAPIDAIFALLRIALVLTFAIAIVGVTSGSFSAVLDRREQIATLRAVGASRRHIVRMIVAESVLRAIAGCGLGAFAALALAYVALVHVPIAVPVMPFALVLAAGASAVVLSAVPGSWLAGRIRVDRSIER